MRSEIRLVNKKLLIFIHFIVFISFAGNNSHGQLGYINTPSAYNNPESSINLSIVRDTPDRRLNLTISPFDWLDATIFYTDIANKPYGNGFNQSYKDKGFNLKLSIINEHRYLPNLAVGFNDFAGTGLYASEYIVLSDKRGALDFTLGIGWGEFAGGIDFKNPLISLNQNFEQRSNIIKGRGGRVDFKNFFSGREASLFGAIGYNLDSKTKIIFELDPTKQNEKIGLKRRKNKLNFGFDKQFENFSFKTSVLGAEELQFQISYRENYKNYKKKKNITKVNSYQELQSLLSKNDIGLMEVAENEDDMYIKVQHNSFENQYEVNQSIYTIIKNSYVENKTINISQEHLGMEVVKNYYNLKDQTNVRNEAGSLEKDYKTVYKVLEPYPLINNTTQPRIKTMIASREGFLYGGLLLENDLEIIFRKNLIFLSNIKYSIFDNFDELYIPPVDTYPNQVRSDIKKYLNNFHKRVVIGRAELNYFKSFNQTHFLRFSTGIYEDMYGGIGFDYLYNPQGSLFSIGAEIYKVKKRDYKMRFGFSDYENVFSRLNFQVIEPYSDLYFRLSYGEYLATDVGYTFEIARRFENGVEFTGFFTRTDVSEQNFGEGSFDKGIRLKIPFKIFNFGKEQQSLSGFEWRPLTKDPGAQLIKSIDIRDRINRFRVY